MFRKYLTGHGAFCVNSSTTCPLASSRESSPTKISCGLSVCRTHDSKHCRSNSGRLQVGMQMLIVIDAPWNEPAQLFQRESAAHRPSSLMHRYALVNRQEIRAKVPLLPRGPFAIERREGELTPLEVPRGLPGFVHLE
jgi:hypothetical protein